MLRLNIAMRKMPMPWKAIKKSRKGDRHYFTVRDKAIQFRSRALLAPGAKCLEEVTYEIARYKRPTKTRKISVVYPRFNGDDNVSTVFPLGDVALKMRDDIGVEREHTGRDGRRYIAGYGISEIEVGIPAKTFMVIWNQLNRQLKRETIEDWQDQTAVLQGYPEHSAVSVRGVRYQDGHYWMMASLQKALRGTTELSDDESGTTNVVAFMRSLNMSVKADAATAFRLKFNRGQWDLRMTLWTVNLKGVALQHKIEHNL